MKYITEVELINFQKHEHFKAKFGMLTAIIGPSDRGKTAIYRGIKWCLYNEPPRGKNFIRRGADQATAIVRFSDGTEIIRSKGTKGNTYDITYEDGKNIHMKDVGSGPIDEVIMAHRMRPLDLFSKTEILNMRDQLAQPFFLGESPTNKVVMIGKIAKTEVIDLAIKNVASEARVKNGELKKYKADLKDTKAKLKEIPNLESMDKAISRAEDKIEAIEYAEMKIKNIKVAIGNLTELQDKKYKLNNILESDKPVSEALQLVEDAIEINSKVDEIKKILAKIRQYEKRKLEAQNFINEVSLDLISEVLSNIDEVIEISNSIKVIKSKRSSLTSLLNTKEELEKLPQAELIDDTIRQIDQSIEIAEAISKIKPVNKKLKDTLTRKQTGEKVINKLKTDYDNALELYKQGLKENKVCPVCMSTITEDHIHNIEHYI